MIAGMVQHGHSDGGDVIAPIAAILMIAHVVR